MNLRARKIWQKHLRSLKKKRDKELNLRRGMLCLWKINTYIYKINLFLDDKNVNNYRNKKTNRVAP